MGNNKWRLTSTDWTLKTPLKIVLGATLELRDR